MNCIFTINNKEILSLVNENNIKNAGKKLFNITKEPVIITNGNKGAILITNDVTIIDGFKVQVKDTIGAGDSHTGGILAGLSCNLNLKDSIYLANKIASIVVSKEGAATAPFFRRIILRKNVLLIEEYVFLYKIIFKPIIYKLHLFYINMILFKLNLCYNLIILNYF